MPVEDDVVKLRKEIALAAGIPESYLGDGGLTCLDVEKAWGLRHTADPGVLYKLSGVTLWRIMLGWDPDYERFVYGRVRFGPHVSWETGRP